MAYTTIDKPDEHFNTVLYTGTGADGKAVTGVGFQPDWLWIKKRSDSGHHVLADSTRGANKQLFSSLTNAEQTSTDFVASFDSDGFTVNDSAVGTGDTNYTNGGTYVSWNWLANGGTTSSNTDGSITSTVQANTDAGFSIVTYTGNGTSGATIGHGLNSAPEWTIIKRRSDTEAWVVWHTSFGSAQSNVRLNGTDAVDTSSPAMFNNTFPTSSLITLGNGNFVNTNTETYVAYCFSEVKGYSKFGSYTGNGNADGTFVYTGFKPAWVMIKHSSGTSNWTINDVARDPTNVNNLRLFPNQNVAENSGSDSMDMLSNGFKFRSTDSGNNGSGATYVYMAFAEHPFVSSKGVPVTAR